MTNLEKAQRLQKFCKENDIKSAILIAKIDDNIELVAGGESCVILEEMLPAIMSMMSAIADHETTDEIYLKK